MIRQDINRHDPKRRAGLDYKKKQFANPTFKQHDYPHRLNFYEVPPTAEITLEQFEQWAIDRLKILAEIETCSFRNKTPAETATHITPMLQKFLPLSANTSSSSSSDPRLKNERQKDHYSHFILRLAFSATEDLRRRFVRVETMLFKFRFQQDDLKERRAFVESLNFDWETVSDEEKHQLADNLLSATPGLSRRIDDESWFKVDWEKVPELVERRVVYMRKGQAYVPMREQLSMILAEFTSRLEKAMELTSRALPRLDEDDRLTPILNHLSKNFGTPDSAYSEGEELPGAPITAASIDKLSQHFPLCMRNLHMQLRKAKHLKHFGRLQYSLFLKGIGLSLEDSLIFWRQSFSGFTDDEFNSKYKYNVRHVYGDVGGDANRRGRGYPPYSCQKILTDSPGSGQTHGCPYRHFSLENLLALLQSTGVTDREVLRGVKEDVEKTRYHIACNRVFEWAHKAEIKKVKDDGTWSQTDLDTIVRPDTYFRRSYLLKNLGKLQEDTEMGG
ncbi:hypothetical protein FQN54_008231 [Arachnomyces sp. PD_36]|nr:hypothetical protein FQN54_008231 [Arachnomyces sp. PD_36]